MISDAAAFWQQFRTDRGQLVDTLAARYPLVPKAYVEHFVNCLDSIDGNSRVLTYVEADLGAPGRGMELIDSLIAGGVRVAGARCLDVGCSNGALLLAAKARGAGQCLGLDTSEARLVSARMACAGSGIEFRQADARQPALDGTFDLVFCTDVLEHVPNWPWVVARIEAALAPSGAAFVSVFNASHPATVLSEPHYGLPGLALLPADEATAIWARASEIVGNPLPYDVHEWPSYAELAAASGAVGLTTMPWVGSEWMSDPFWEGYRERHAVLLSDATAALERVGLPPHDSRRLRHAIAGYGYRFIADHERFERIPEMRLELYATYYAQPLNALLTRA